MANKKKEPTIESKALTIAIKRAMAMRDIKVPALAKMSGVPYGTLRKILELNTVSDYEQLRRIAQALRMPLSRIILDAEALAEDPDIIADYRKESVDPTASADPVSDAESLLSRADNGVDIDLMADRVRAEDALKRLDGGAAGL